MKLQPFIYSAALDEKIQFLLARQKPHKIGPIELNSPLFLAPMSNISHAPFRYLMQGLGAGGSISELVSCHGINHGNEKTLNMLRVAEKENCTGIQLFGEDPESMAKAAMQAQEYRPKFIDINMGCPVRKVVTKGAGSALLKDLSTLESFFAKIKNSINIPLSIKIRTGWDLDSLNADEVIKIAKNTGVFMVSIHGRTRSQKYTGKANWDYIEETAKSSSLPLIGNGDLVCPRQIQEKLESTNCAGLMIGRGALRNPFIFLETLDVRNEVSFHAKDHLEIIKALNHFLDQSYDRERFKLIQLKKFIVWFAAGFNSTAKFRSTIFPAKTHEQVFALCEEYFLNLGSSCQKKVDQKEDFLMSGHG